jgi:hypothetical protein
MGIGVRFARVLKNGRGAAFDSRNCGSREVVKFVEILAVVEFALSDLLVIQEIAVKVWVFVHLGRRAG